MMQKRVLALLVACLVLSGSSVLGAFYSYDRGYRLGFFDGINVTSDFIETATGIKVQVEQLPGGLYKFTAVMPDGSLVTKLRFELHLWARHCRNGELVSETYHAMSLTTFGKNWIADNIGKVGGTNATKFVTYLGCSNDSSSFSAAWTSIPSEITASGLGRANGTFADTGAGTWNLTKTFTASGTVSTKLYGAYFESYANFVGCLIAAEQQGPGSQKNMLSGDTLQLTLQGTIS